jgi:hypothetical protein
MWAADPEFKHVVRQVPNGPTIHVLYNDKPNDAANDAAWTKVADAAVSVLPFIEKKFGKYPYKQYSFIHGGDGGMEYPMATLLAGPGLGTAFHEWMHSWFQMILGTDESKYAWMDEGFTSFGESLVTEYYQSLDKDKAAVNAAGVSTGPKRTIVDPSMKESPHARSVPGTIRLYSRSRSARSDSAGLLQPVEIQTSECA